ncbi:MAG: TonB-dependent receptor [Acidobacteria bacterium]|nr:TonB-dependent receptor [Acidobacteriota bacterium]
MKKAIFTAGSLILAATIILLGSPPALAQVTYGEITGTVMDATKAVIPGVEVIATNVATGISRNGLSEANGLYRIPLLQPGSYTVKASITGFKTAVREGITVTVGQIVHVDIILEVGNIAETVTVTGEASTVETEQGRVSTLVDSKRILDMPLNGRNIYSLMQLAPGAVNSTATVTEPGESTNVNGGRANFNGFWLDGVTNKGLSGGTNITPNVDSIQEFRMESLNFSAEFGNSSGSVVNVVSKAGTNDFHGTAYEFLRNDNADAREFFDETKPEYKRNQFGASFGGPIRKNSTFFFTTYEGLRQVTGNSILQSFETPQWASYAQKYGAPVAQFLYKNYPVGKPIATITDTVGDYLAGWGFIGEPSQAEVDDFLGSTFGSPPGALSADAPMQGETSFFLPDRFSSNQFSVRLDQEFRGGKDKLFGRYYWHKSNGVIHSPSQRAAFDSPQEVEAHQPSLSETYIFSPKVVNEFRVGLNRNRNDILAGTPGVPQIIDGNTGTTNFGAYNGYPQLFTENVFHYSDVVNITKGSHGMKAGVEVRRNQENSEFNVGRPSYTFYNLVYIALDDPYYQVGGVDPHIVDGTRKAELFTNRRGWRNTEFGAFFNDDWKIARGLTLNLGIRYDLYTRLTEVQDRATQYTMDKGNNVFERVRNGGFAPAKALSTGDHNNFAPRIGFAWDPFQDGKMSIRGGYGVAYQAGVYNPLANSRWNPPYYSFNLICDVCGRPNEVVLYGPQTPGQAVTATGPNPNIGARSFEGNIIAYEPTNNNSTYLTGIPNPRMREPYVQSWFFGIQREITRDLSIEANYVGTAGRKLIRAKNFNRFPGDRIGWPSPTGEFSGSTALNRVNSAYGNLRFWENSVNSSYNALQTQIAKRFSKGYAVTANYTWAKSLDVRSTWHSGATTSNGAQEGYSTDVTKVYLDYGRSIFDARHRFAVSAIWDLPLFANSRLLLQNLFGGWQLNGILSLQSGQPFTPFDGRSFSGGAGGDYNADGTNNDRPNAPSIGNTVSSKRTDWVHPGAGPFRIAAASSSGVPSTAEKIAFFGKPAAGTNGTLGRNTFEGPGFSNVDFSLFKNFKIPSINEEAKLQFRFEFFNALNRVNFYQPTPTINSSTFGRATDTFAARQIQFGFKFIF